VLHESGTDVPGNASRLSEKNVDNKSPIRGDHSLNAIAFERLLRRLGSDREAAGEQYEALRRRLVKFFQWNSCFPSEDLADETLDRLAQKLSEHEIHDIFGFALGMAKKVSQEAHKKSRRTVHITDLDGWEDTFPQTGDAEGAIHDAIENDLRTRCLQTCAAHLTENDRALFFAYFSSAEDSARHRQALAERLGLTMGALRVRVTRLREQLEKCVRKCRKRKGFGAGIPARDARGEAGHDS